MEIFHEIAGSNTWTRTVTYKHTPDPSPNNIAESVERLYHKEMRALLGSHLPQ